MQEFLWIFILPFFPSCVYTLQRQGCTIDNTFDSCRRPHSATIDILAYLASSQQSRKKSAYDLRLFWWSSRVGVEQCPDSAFRNRFVVNTT